MSWPRVYEDLRAYGASSSSVFVLLLWAQICVKSNFEAFDVDLNNI